MSKHSKYVLAPVKFEVKPVRYKVEGGLMITGRVREVEKGTIIVRIVQGFTVLEETNKVTELRGYDIVESETTRLFDLEFQPNRIPYLLQHTALNWLKKHDLFEKFIANPKYEVDVSKVAAHEDNASLNFESLWLKNLNEEQRRAVELIVPAKNKQLPFLLFGPPGQYIYIFIYLYISLMTSTLNMT